jgi:A/G-specific adenine glycosylase
LDQGRSQDLPFCKKERVYALLLKLLPPQIESFKTRIYEYYEESGRILPWRGTVDPYCILVSEIMLQQTQVERVMGKYQVFLENFPDFLELARAELKDVLRVWQGLGYNRRALTLKEVAETVVQEYDAVLPRDAEVLQNLPGIGKATAGAILAFAYNIPSVFIETNIRRTFIHHFFQDDKTVKDSEIIPLVELTLDRQNPRTWYYALMDYGSMLGKSITNPNRRSAHYQRQEPFENSDRRIRGTILKALLQKNALSVNEVCLLAGFDSPRVTRILVRMEKEGLVREQDGSYRIP